MAAGYNPLILLPIGIISLVIGSLSIIAGFGGGVFLVPVLTVFFGISLKTVIGTVLLSLVFPAAIGSIGAWKRGEIDFRLAIMFEIPTIIGSIIGATITSSEIIPEFLLKLCFGLLAIFFSYNMLNKVRQQQKGITRSNGRFLRKLTAIPPIVTLENNNTVYTISIPVIASGGLIIGFLAGMLGVGGGWLKTPLSRPKFVRNIKSNTTSWSDHWK
ncbi:MAG: sulfite exporter TauE/SafE family protein [Candidatus Hodarchaeales archaeon]